jgi:hypothetical protein
MNACKKLELIKSIPNLTNLVIDYDDGKFEIWAGNRNFGGEFIAHMYVSGYGNPWFVTKKNTFSFDEMRYLMEVFKIVKDG